MHPAEILSAVAKVDLGFLVLALLCQVASNWLAGFRWYLTMNILDMLEPPSFFVKSFFKGTFFNQVLPGSIGGDGIRMLDLKTGGHASSDAVEGVIIDRGIGLLSLLVICLFGSFLGTGLLPPAVFRGIRYICVSGIVGFGFFAIIFRVPIFKKIKRIFFLIRISEKIGRVFSAGRRTALIIVLSISVHLLAIFAVHFLSLSVGQGLGLLLFVVIFPSVVLLTALPISFAGWGVREGAMVGLFMSAGVDKTPVLFISLLYGFVVIIASFPGLFFWLIKQKDKRPQHAACLTGRPSNNVNIPNVRLKYE